MRAVASREDISPILRCADDSRGVRLSLLTVTDIGQAHGYNSRDVITLCVARHSDSIAHYVHGGTSEETPPRSTRWPVSH
ncbi:hypothetical protein J6590_038892 [Homalodisca vitripennis]|nr:hypothetical protein J6590_038892 [Homalodisca vitripennis]